MLHASWASLCVVNRGDCESARSEPLLMTDLVQTSLACIPAGNRGLIGFVAKRDARRCERAETKGNQWSSMSWGW